MTKLQVIAGGLASTPSTIVPTAERVLHPRSTLSSRAGITPTRVPGDMWVAPALVTAMRPPRRLRAVA